MVTKCDTMSSARRLLRCNLYDLMLEIEDLIADNLSVISNDDKIKLRAANSLLANVYERHTVKLDAKFNKENNIERFKYDESKGFIRQGISKEGSGE